MKIAITVHYAIIATFFLAFQGPSTAAAQDHINIEIPGSQAELETWIHERWARVPTEVRGLKREKLKEVQILVDSLVRGCGHYLNKWPEGPSQAEVSTILAQCMSLNRQRHRSDYSKTLKEAGLPRPEIRAELSAEMDKYVSEVLSLCDRTLKVSKNKAQLARLHLVSADLKQHKREYGPAAIHYRSCYDSDPKGPYASRALFSRLKALIDNGDYAACRKEAPQFLKLFQKSDRYPDVCYLMHLSYRREGLLEEGKAHWDLVRPFLKAGARGQAVPGTEEDPWIVDPESRSSWEDYYGRSHFYQAFFEFALLEYEKATVGFEAFFDYFDEAATLVSMPQPLDVYRQFQAVPYHTTLTVLVNNPAPPVGVGESWSNPSDEMVKTKNYESSIVLFCNGNNARRAQRPLLEQLSGVAKEYNSELIWISTPGRIKESDPEQTMEAREEQFLELQAELNFAGEFGFDVEKTIHDAYYINPGTASLFVLDKSGKVRWHLIYPTHHDLGLIRSVIKGASSAAPKSSKE